MVQAIQHFLWVVNDSDTDDRSNSIHVGVTNIFFIQNDYASKAYSMFTGLVEHNGFDTTLMFKVQQLLDARE